MVPTEITHTDSATGAQQNVAHPYMANSVGSIKDEMLSAIGASSVDELFEQVPADHRVKEPIRLPPTLKSEVELRRHLLDVLRQNETCVDNLSFLGAGCWQHYVPGICDEIAGRREFLTNIWGTSSSDHGRNQALFEFCSQIGELVDLDCVGMPVYSWGCAAGHAIRMAARMTGRREVVIASSVDPERLSVIHNYCGSGDLAEHINVRMVRLDRADASMDLDDLEEALSPATAAVYFEVPNYLGTIDPRAAEIAHRARGAGAEVVVGVDPTSLGVIAPPPHYGASMVVGTIQPLGLHLLAGGSVGGFIATPDEERYVREYPTLLQSVAETTTPGQLGFGMTLLEQSSYDAREAGKDWTGHTVHLWGVVSAAYMSLLGPEGFHELGEVVLARSHYAAQRVAAIDGVKVLFGPNFFKEFVVNFDDTGRTVGDVNRALRRHRIFGGKDLSPDFPDLGQSALYCVTEVHSQTDIDALVSALMEVIEQ